MTEITEKTHTTPYKDYVYYRREKPRIKLNNAHIKYSIHKYKPSEW